jgi:hypothetical protein
MSNREQVQKADSQAMDAILEWEDRRPRIPETEFKQSLLPMLADPANEDYSLWLKIAGSWQRPIEVESDQDGELLFTVPPLVERTSDPLRQSGRDSAYETVMNSARKMEISHVAGGEYLQKKLLPRIRVSGDRKENIERWNMIFERYGLTHLLVSVEDGSSDASASNSGTVEFDGYDEL